jgi:hypothetical protein
MDLKIKKEGKLLKGERKRERECGRSRWRGERKREERETEMGKRTEETQRFWRAKSAIG